MPHAVLVVVAVLAFALVLVAFARWARAGGAMSTRALAAVVAGATFGIVLQATLGLGSPALRATLEWIAIVGAGYVRLLQMAVAPLVLVTILGAVVQLRSVRALGTISAGVLGVLLTTTAASALVGVLVARAFGLRADGLVQGARELEKGAKLLAQAPEAQALTIPSLLQAVVPSNVVADLAGTRPLSVIGVVTFAVLLGLAALALRTEEPEIGERVLRAIETLQRLVLRLVRLVIRLTPYGVLALMTRLAATADARDIVQLGVFVVASYAGLLAILALHALLVALTGTTPLAYLAHARPALLFAFSSRSSAATIPLTVEAQVERLGVPRAAATFAASIGATVGQNACAGLYPAMLAVMIAPSAGVDPATWSFAGAVVVAATIGSIGIAGVGGGATFAALVVLSTLQLPVALAGVLISIEPLIDMGRTAVNVSGALTAGTVTGAVLRRRGAGHAAAEDADAVRDAAPVHEDAVHAA